jgi:uncharacterized protein YdeI (YjbR/CyaY-like superfamily)
MKPKFFSSPELFRQWLEKNHASTQELLIGFHKKDSGKQSITYAQALDEALCMVGLMAFAAVLTKRVTRSGSRRESLAASGVSLM